MPEDWPYWGYVYNVIEEVVLSAGIDRVDTPILEKNDLFVHTLSEEGEDFSKDFYSFDIGKISNDKKKKSDKTDGLTTLRPEITSGIIRMYIENNLSAFPKPISLYAIGKCFRNDNAQVGKYREFNQLSVEIIGAEDPLIDANLISLMWDIGQKLKIANLEAHINSVGCNECRPRIKKMLSEYFKKKQNKLCENCKKKIKKNPLGILSCKNDKCESVIAGSPLTIDNICEECKKHFTSVLEFLDEMGIAYNLSPNLVRDYDYYNRTVFDFTIGEKKQGFIGGGGRYDGLIERLGGEISPAVGFAVNLDLLAEYVKNNGIKIPKIKSKVNVFVIQLGEDAKKIAIKKTKEIRKLGISTGIAIGKDTIKAQLKSADKVNALFAVIIGQREAVTGTALVRDMRDGVQETVELEDLNHKVFNLVEERIKEEEAQVKRQRLK